MSHTSESVAPSLGAMSRYSLVFESKTATFETLATTVPLRCLTWVNWPPSQMLEPTCSIARTRPSIIGVSSGISEGNARATPLATSIARAIEASSRPVLRIPLHPSLVGQRKNGVRNLPAPLRNGVLQYPIQFVHIP